MLVFQQLSYALAYLLRWPWSIVMDIRVEEVSQEQNINIYLGILLTDASSVLPCRQG